MQVEQGAGGEGSEEEADSGCLSPQLAITTSIQPAANTRHTVLLPTHSKEKQIILLLATLLLCCCCENHVCKFVLPLEMKQEVPHF